MSDFRTTDATVTMPTAPPTAALPTVPPVPGPAAAPSTQRASRRSRTGSAAQWTRWLHVYTSMISLLIVLFFGITGLTLNHPSWTLGRGPSTVTHTGTIPAGFADGGNVDFLAVTEYVRSQDGVRGNVADYSATATQGSISFKQDG